MCVCYYRDCHDALAFASRSRPAHPEVVHAPYTSRHTRTRCCLVVLVLVAPFLIPVNQFRPPLKRKLPRRWGAKWMWET